MGIQFIEQSSKRGDCFFVYAGFFIYSHFRDIMVSSNVVAFEKSSLTKETFA